MTEDLMGIKDVLALFPKESRPSKRRLIAKAKEAGYCVKIGRGLGIPPKDIDALWEFLKCSGSRNTGSRPIGRYAGPLQGGSYIEVRKLLTERKRKNLGKVSKEQRSEM